jgi:DNA-directed RNA polymerase specialized sigma24 family protein
LQFDKKQFCRLEVELDHILAKVLWKRTKDEPLVKDLMQETYVRLLEALQAGASIDSIPNYAIGIAINVHKEWLRQRALELPLEGRNHDELGEYAKSTNGKTCWRR